MHVLSCCLYLIVYMLSASVLTGAKIMRVGGVDPLKISRRGQSMFDPLKYHVLSFKTVV